jgi:hypothetical protein
MSKRHKYKKHTKEDVLSIGKSKYTAAGVGFVNPTLADAPCVVNPSSPFADLLKTLPRLAPVNPPTESH